MNQRQPQKAPLQTQANPGVATTGAPKEEMIRINGREQVLDMLRVADPTFREVILRGLEKRDPALARELRRNL